MISIPRDEQIDVFMETARSHLNRWYIWGGDDPFGFDCSGLVVECLKAAGLIETDEDFTADGLWHKYHHGREVARKDVSEGCLALWFNNRGRATHVAICTSNHFCITADGGGSKTNTEADARKHNAYIKFRPIDHRRSAPRFVDPFVSGRSKG